MELAQLKYFQVMANIRHFTRAARMLDVTQPALSRSMAKLEKDLEVSLFKRSEGEIELTPEGERLLRRVDRILREVDSAREEAGSANAEVSKEFRLSFIHSLGSYVLPHILQDFRALSRHPHPAEPAGFGNARAAGRRRGDRSLPLLYDSNDGVQRMGLSLVGGAFCHGSARASVCRA